MGDRSGRRFLIVAGEPSGDRHAARLVRALAPYGEAEVRGVTGPALEAAGARRVVPMATLSVLGFTGVVSRLPRILAAHRRLVAEAARFRPHAVVLVDSPGFNFRIGPALRRLGHRIFYYIAPQVWAWHPERAAAMARWVDRLAVVFPFEEPLFREAGVDARYVGHPLMEDLEPEVDRATLLDELGRPAEEDRMLGLLPGSRPQELRAHLGVMLEAAVRLARTRPDLTTVLALAGGTDPRRLPCPARALEGVRVVTGRTRAVERAATACCVASGTATLETALFGTPLAIVYRTGRLNYAIARRLVRLERIGLPNIVAGREVAPELIQDRLSPARLADAVAPWLDDPVAAAVQRAGLAEVRDRLEGPVASREAARLLWDLAA